MEGNQLTENEKSVLLEYEISYDNYVKKYCCKCDLKKKEKRKCSLLLGFKKPSCAIMIKSLNARKQNKYVRELLAKEIFEEVNKIIEEIK
jgi:hypothetical protein